MNRISRLAAKLTAGITGARPPSGAKAPEDFNTLLAIERTNLAQERTIMAWVRTATSLISFGFTIYKFFQLEAKDRVLTSQVIGPRTFALLMILMGLFGLVIATMQHREYKRRMLRDHPNVPYPSPAGWIAGLISVLGVVAMVSVILGW
jgi:putative membrane protein